MKTRFPEIARCSLCMDTRALLPNEKAELRNVTVNGRLVRCGKCGVGFMGVLKFKQPRSKAELEVVAKEDRRLQRSEAGRRGFNTRVENGNLKPTLHQRLSVGYALLRDSGI